MAKKGRKQAFCSGSPLPSDVLTLRNTTASTATCSESIANDFVFQNHHAKTGKRVSFDVVTDAKRHQGERAYRRLCSRSSRRRVCCIPTRVEAQIPGGEPLWIHLPQNVQDHKQSEDAWWRFPSKINVLFGLEPSNVKPACLCRIFSISRRDILRSIYSYLPCPPAKGNFGIPVGPPHVAGEVKPHCIPRDVRQFNI